MDWPILLIPLAFFAGSALYASVGHGGASAYLLIMVLLGFSPETLRPTALSLNIAVSSLGTYLFWKSGSFQGRLFFPTIAASIPLAFLGARIQLEPAWFHLLLGLTLLIAALRLLFPDKPESRGTRIAPLAWLFIGGGTIGLLSGLIGVGGGIFLTPLLILARWATPKEAAAVSAPFILVNSIAGIIGLGSGQMTPDPRLPWLMAAVLAGGLIGAWFGSRGQRPYFLCCILALVLGAAALKLIIS